jgi:Uma2 family endonuclease
MAITRRRLTLDQFLALPEGEPALELEPDGTVTRKVSPKGQHSRLQFILCQRVNDFAEERRLALAFPELRAVFGGAAYVPDVAVYRWARIPRTTEGRVANDFRLPPDVAIEVVSPEQSANALVRRCVWYVANGVEVALLVDPADESVLLFRSQSTPRVLRGGDRIDLDPVLPGFELITAELFDALRLS